MGVKFRDGKKEFKALVISPSALSALSRKEGSAQWELFRASQLTWLVQHAALMNDTLSWKPRRKKTSFLLETPACPKAGEQHHGVSSPNPTGAWGPAGRWRGPALRWPQAGGNPTFWEPTMHTQWGLWERAAALNPCSTTGRLKGAQARRRSPRDRRRTEVCCSLELVPYVTD